MSVATRTFMNWITVAAASVAVLLAGEVDAIPRHSRGEGRTAHGAHRSRHGRHGRRGDLRLADRIVPSSDASDSTRRQDALRSFARSGLVRRCWMQHLMRFPTSASRTLELAVHVSPEGVIAVSAPGDRSSLAGCIAFGARALPRVAAGMALDAGTTVVLEQGAQ